MHVATPPAPCPPSTAHLALPFFDDAHRALADGLVPWAAAQQVDELQGTACGRFGQQRDVHAEHRGLGRRRRQGRR